MTVTGIGVTPTTQRFREKLPTRRRYLMCEPRYFDVRYTINPWMDPTVPVDADLALRQWRFLVETYRRLGHQIDFIDPLPGNPDMVFAANGATVANGKVYGAKFRYDQRAAEGPAYLEWLKAAGFRQEQKTTFVNEGEGDLLVAGSRLLAGTGFRTDLQAHAEAGETLGLPVVSLELVDPRYYHLDTALSVLSVGGDEGDEIAYFPGAFTQSSQATLQRLYPQAVIATARDAASFGLNAVSDGYHVVLPGDAIALASQLRARGYQPVPVELGELRKAGGGPKCCTLELRS